ncbi:hypothetical protein QF023_003781 [Chryseobacterium sp. SLBN-27]|uniref:hypothetical protein n=3 Tax=Chryseobacterium TaxID=59732 RepID=UPI002861B245|nr:hypothetical protein [Chryseobacterium sp. SLBN-27]MDR6160265.1 hypothetical protein [Chryseobacterium sp. SLBN-27]
MVRNKINLVFLSLSLLSCKKESNKDLVSSNSLFNDITNLKQYDNVQKVDEDTLIRIKASNNEYIIDGYISKKLNKKTGWWNIQDKNNEINKVRLQYIYFENKEKINQFIFYKNNIIDSTKSKFYVLDKIGNIMKYSFFTPKSKESVISANLYYIIMNENNDILKESKIEDGENNNQYLFKLEIPITKKVMIKGLFSEKLNLEDKSLGVNEILTEDLVILK